MDFNFKSTENDDGYNKYNNAPKTHDNKSITSFSTIYHTFSFVYMTI